MITRRLGFLIGIVSIFIALSLSSTASAAGKVDDMTVSDQVKAYLLYHSVGMCFDGINDFSVTYATDTVWSDGRNSDKNIIVGYYLASDDATWECKTIVSNLLPMLGYSSIGDMLESWGYVIRGTDWHHDDKDLGPDRAKALQNNLFGGKVPTFNGHQWYELAQKIFVAQCKPTNGILYAEANSSKRALADNPTPTSTVMRVSVVSGTPPALVDMIYDITPIDSTGDPRGGEAKELPYGPTLGGFISCVGLAKKISDNAAIYMAYVKLNEESGYTGSGIDTYDNNDNGSDQTTCAVEGIGWIICPVVTFLAHISAAAHDQLNTLLTVDSKKLFDTSDTPGTAYSYWQIMRNYANIAFIFVFLFVIFSQITGAGISNYGIKKLLPKMVVVAILVNLSFFVCAFAVDISNLLGVALTNFISGVAPPAAGEEASYWSTGGGGFVKLASGALLLGTVAYFALASVVGLLVFVVIASITVLFILGLRQALIILLVVISPLAFVAYLLPNTEGLFKKWWGMLKSLLLIFPIIGLLFGAGKLASNILSSSDQLLVQVVAGFLLFAPLIMAYTILKAALSGFGALGQLSGKFQGGANSSLNKQAQDRLGDTSLMKGRGLRKQGKQAFRDRRFAKGVSGSDLSRMGRARARLARGVTGRTFSEAGDYAQERMEDRALASVTAEDNKEYAEGVQVEKEAQQLKTNRQLIVEVIKNKGATKQQKSAAIDRIMTQGSFAERQIVREAVAADKEQFSPSQISSVIQSSFAKGDGDILGKNFGDDMLTGKITSPQDFADSAVTNAQKNTVTAEHWAANGGASMWLTEKVVASGNTTARTNLKTAATKASAPGSITESRLGGEHKVAEARL